jgi:hypothetical protein
MMLLLLASAIAAPVHATMTVVFPATPVPALGLLVRLLGLPFAEPGRG